MKSSVCSLIVALLFAPLVYGQSVPENVKKTCAAKFPGMSEVEWEVTKGVYLADFSHEEKYKTAKFDEKGTWLETRTYLEEDDLPTNVVNNINAKYEDVYYESIMKVENSKNETLYDLIINVDEDVIFIAANQAGQIIKSEVQPSEDMIDTEEEEEE